MARCANCNKEVGCSCQMVDRKFCSQNCKDEYANKSNSNLSELSESQVAVLADQQLSVSPN